MSPLPIDRHAEKSLAETYPAQTTAMYQACEDGVLRHTGKGSIFGSLKTDVRALPQQHVDVQLVEQQALPIEQVVAFGEALSPGVTEVTEDFIDQHHSQISDVYDALMEGHNVVIAVPTHSEVHDIVFPLAQVAMGLKDGYDYDVPENRYQIFAKSLAWYNYAGMPIPEVGKMLANTIFTLPHSRSGDHFDNQLRDEFNARALRQLWLGLNTGRKMLVLATGGATNHKRILPGGFGAECQAAIHPGTARLMTDQRNLVLPVACHLDKDRSLSVKLGDLKDLETEDECFQVGKWAAREYQKMSGHLTFQAPTREQAEDFLKAKAEDLEEIIANSRAANWLRSKHPINR